MGLLLFPTGLLTPQEDGLFAEWHEDLMLEVADTASMLGMKYPNPAFAVTSWGLRAYVELDNQIFDPSSNHPFSSAQTGGVVYYIQ